MSERRKRRTVGSVCKSKTPGQPDYIKLSDNVNLSKGAYINLESKQQKVAGIQRALEEGKLKEEMAEKLLERANKMPDWVRYELYVLE